MGLDLSIIIPIYGVEKYLKRCLDCLVQQEKKNEFKNNVEIILVDDGSKDKSGQICDEYTETNKIFKVIHKENAGAASARNAGLDIAQGMWITFIDPDDEVDMNYLITVLEITRKLSEFDCILFGMMIKNEKDGKTYFYDNSFFCGEIADWIRLTEKKGLLNYPWNKIYKREIIERCSPVRFPESKEPGEDLVFNCKYFERCKKGAMIEKHLYMYHKQRNAEESLSHKYWPDLNEKTEFFIKSRCHMYQKIGMHLKEDEEELAKQNLYYIYKCIPNMYKQRKYFKISKRLIFYKKIIEDKQINHWVAIDPNDEIVIRIFKLLYKMKSAILFDMIYSVLFAINNTVKRKKE